MRKIYQTVVHADDGNCMQATFASLFDVQLEEAVNPIIVGEYHWFKAVRHWLRRFGYSYAGVRGFIGHWDTAREDLKNSVAVKDHFYAVVPSKTFHGKTHALVINREGIVVHDPNPNGLWLGVDVIETQSLECIWLLDLIENEPFF